MTRRLLTPFRSLLQLLDPPFKPKSVKSRKLETQWEIPLEIVEVIFQLLSDLDRACLAVCCKKLHAYYVLYNKKHRISVLSTVPRTLLLRRLQNDRWVYCIRCENLHRRSKWRSFRCSWTFGTKPTISECNIWCDPQSNEIVDMCPCSSITYHQKQHPLRYFQSQVESTRESNYHLSGGRLVHYCVVQHPLVRVFISTKAEINSMTNKFEVESQFTFQTSEQTASSRLFRNISSRLNRYETESWLKSFFIEAQPDFFIGEAKSNWYQCHDWEVAENRPYTFRITLRRFLGGDGMPSKGWKDNCHTKQIATWAHAREEKIEAQVPQSLKN